MVGFRQNYLFFWALFPFSFSAVFTSRSSSRQHVRFALSGIIRFMKLRLEGCQAAYSGSLSGFEMNTPFANTERIGSNKKMRKRGSYHHGDLRAALIDAARQLIEEKGPDRITMSDASRAAGVSTAAPYRHFPDLGALLLVTAEEGMSRQRKDLENATVGQEPGSLEGISAIGLAYLAFAVREPGIFRLMFALTKKHKDRPSLVNAGKATFEVVLRQIAYRLKCRVDDPIVLDRGLKLWAFVHGLAFLLIDEKIGGSHLNPDCPALVSDMTARTLADL